MAKTSEKLELISSLRESLSEKETALKDVSDRLLQAEHSVRAAFPSSVLLASVRLCVTTLFFSFCSPQLENVSQKCSSSEKQRSELKTEVVDLTQKLSALKEKV